MAKRDDVRQTFERAGLAGAGCEFSDLDEQARAYRALSAQQPRILPADEQPRPHFVAVKSAVMLGDLCVGKMRSKTMAKRTANALNKHVPNREGV